MFWKLTYALLVMCWASLVFWVLRAGGEWFPAFALGATSMALYHGFVEWLTERLRRRSHVLCAAPWVCPVCSERLAAAYRNGER